MIPINTTDKIIAYTKESEPPATRNNYKDLFGQAIKQKNIYQQYLPPFPEYEFEVRVKSRKLAQVRQADFLYKKYLQDLQHKKLPKNAQSRIDVPERLEFIKQGQKVILAGNPGIGKTCLSIGLGIKACYHYGKPIPGSLDRNLWRPSTHCCNGRVFNTQSVYHKCERDLVPCKINRTNFLLTLKNKKQ